MFLRAKRFQQIIPQVKVEDGEVITCEKATTSLRRAVHFFSALQAADGHWPAENAGPLSCACKLQDTFLLFSLQSTARKSFAIYITIKYANWGVCFTYGAWFALGGLTAAGKSYDNSPTIRRAVEFLLRKQNEDGGWGES
ncbi:hypothetical protein FEM48_Zijuj10G0003800 [Ziziphus jujuba var. spinosa]|uniref:Squalene cyclase C-terminal domain-containing protein n=1 Tax=Ziziphus jujuba var. spinosa TaxID=714518 RepID=A0A978UK67_ZIZJJ|nr:hypothetical protein FEM48_Zijuj10G0003800 [Ziziphus jujuba var. spinosa]